jgi:hypothetical protein
MRFGILLLMPITVLVGCGEPTYEECVREAVEDGRSEYGIQVLTDLCDQAEQKKREKADRRCFTALTKQYGAPAVQIYRGSLTGRTGQCEFNADLSDEVVKANLQDAYDLGIVNDAAVATDADAAVPAPPDSAVGDYGEPVYCATGGC